MFMLLLSIMGIWFVVYIIKKMGDVELADAFEDTLKNQGLENANNVYIGAKTKQYMRENDKFFETGFGHKRRKKEAMEKFREEANNNKYDLRNTTLGNPAFYYYVETEKVGKYGEVRNAYTLKTQPVDKFGNPINKDNEDVEDELTPINEVENKENKKQYTTEERIELLEKEIKRLKVTLGEGKVINDEY